MWITLKLKVFRNKDKSFFPIYACDHCAVMRGFQDLSLNQNFKIVSKKRCIHSIIAEYLVQKKGDWREIWPVNLDAIRDDDEMFNVQVNIELRQSMSSFKRTAYFWARFITKQLIL